MDVDRKHKILKSVPLLKGRTDKSIEKAADSFLDLSNKLFSVAFLTILVVPLSTLLKNLFDENTMSTFTSSGLEAFTSANGIIVVIVWLVAVGLSYYFRRLALNLYDVLHS